MTAFRKLSEKEKALIILLQEEFPVCEEPFRVLADRLDMDEEDVIEMVRRLQEARCLKRLAAVLYHTKVGYTVNAMLAFDVPDDTADRAAEILTALPQVSHCYLRTRDPGFDYNLFAMAHAKSEDELTALTGELTSLICPRKLCVLKTEQELKKTGMKYFI